MWPCLSPSIGPLLLSSFPDNVHISSLSMSVCWSTDLVCLYVNKNKTRPSSLGGGMGLRLKLSTGECIAILHDYMVCYLHMLSKIYEYWMCIFIWLSKASATSLTLLFCLSCLFSSVVSWEYLSRLKTVDAKCMTFLFSLFTFCVLHKMHICITH